VKATIATYRAFLEELRMGRELALKDADYDTGAATKLNEYGLADKTYSKLLRQLAKDHFACVTPELRENILRFYSDSPTPNETANDRKERKRSAEALKQLRANPVSAEVADSCKAK